VGDVDARVVQEERGDDVRHAAHARRAVVEPAGIRFRLGDQGAQALRFRVGASDDDERRLRDERGRHQVVRHVPRQLLEESRQHRVGGVDQHDRRAVGRAFRARFPGEPAARAGAVLDDEQLAGLLADLHRREAAVHVARAAGREGHEDVRGLRAVLGMRA